MESLEFVIARSPDLIGTTKQSSSNIDCFAITRNDRKRILPYIMSAAIIFLLIFFNVKLFNPQTIISKTVADYTNDREILWRVSKISDEYLPKSIKRPSTIDEINQQPITAMNSAYTNKIIEYKTSRIIAEVIAREKSYARVNVAHFPAWKIFIDGILQTPDITERGYLLIVDKGKHIITASYEATSIEKIANILSISGLAVLIIGIIYFRKFRFKQ